MSNWHQAPPTVSTENSVSERYALRLRAEDAYRGSAADLSDQLSSMSSEALHHALHELGVHQIELEMQNEELRRTQDELDTAQAKYFDFYDMAPVGYCTVNGTGLIEQANLTVAAMLGKHRNLVVRQVMSHFILPDDRDIFYLMRQRIINTRQPQSCELRFVKQDGKKFWARLDALAVYFQLGAPTLRIVITDITERKIDAVALRDSVAYLENLINDANGPIMVCDLRLRITLFNHAFELLTGRRSTEVVGRSIALLFPTERTERSMALIRQTLTGERWNKFEIDIQHQDRSMRIIEWNSATLMAPDGKTVQSVVVQGHDITERKLAEEEISRYIIDLEDAFPGHVERDQRPRRSM